MFDNMMWGEADCFIQYHFPTQAQTGVPGAPIVRHSMQHTIQGNYAKIIRDSICNSVWKFSSRNTYICILCMILSLIFPGVPQMKTFRSATTLCIPDPTFNDITRHRMCLPQGSPVQRELLTGTCTPYTCIKNIQYEVFHRLLIW